MCYICMCVHYNLPSKSKKQCSRQLEKGMDEMKWVELEIDSPSRKLRASSKLQ